ncbi:MAG: tryptophan--tRNA ligase [Parcubacteria group bacterium]|nr:tryptophan--tRNA ligase [Parcubacteria group bacterium]
MTKPILISGIQPSGKLHTGNYLGALKNFVELQNSRKYDCYFFIADYHSLTESFDATGIPLLMEDYLAAGLDPKKSTLFIQSQVPKSTELAWILSALTPFGELARMTQFKEKAWSSKKDALVKKLSQALALYRKKNGLKLEEDEMKEVENELVKSIPSSEFLNVEGPANVGLFTYPVLMTADILLYDAEFVPVGDDQLQHLELARTLVRKFNNKFGKVFVEPKPLLTKTPRIMSLSDPAKKMSKSVPQSCLFLDDSPETIRKKVMSATTDSGREVKYDETEKPGITNLIKIYEGFSGKSVIQIENEFAGKNYGEFKTALAEVITKNLKPFREKSPALGKKAIGL